MRGRLQESSLVILGPFVLISATLGVLEHHAADLGRRSTTVRLEAGGSPGSQAAARTMGGEGPRLPTSVETKGEAGLRRELEHNPEHAQANYDLGLLLLQRSRHAAAIEVLTKAVEVSGGNSKASALFALGLAHSRSHQPRQAAHDFRRSIEYQPNQAEAWLQLGHAEAQTLGGEDAAELAYRKSLSLQPASATARVALGRLLASRERTDEAAEHYRKAIEADPYSKDARYEMALILEELGDPAGARIQYEWLARSEAGTTRALLTQGNIALQDGELERAIDLYKKAIEVGHDREAEPRLKLGQSLYRADRHEDALQAYEACVERFPSNLQGVLGAARTLLALGRAEEALNRLGHAAVQTPERPEIWFLRGRALSRLERPVEAMASYEKTLDLRPADRKAMLNLAVLRRQGGEAESAIVLYRRILERHTAYVPALFNLALILAKTGEVSEASELYARIVETDPKHEAARLNLAVLVGEKGQVKHAEALLRDALLQNPANLSARYNLALLLDRTGRAEEAAPELKRVTLLDDGFAKGWKSLGRVLESRGDTLAALHAYERALVLEPLSRLAREGLGRCRKLLDAES